MKYFLCKLVPPRPTFPSDMSEDERSIMRRHVTYWTSLMERGQVVLYGPVADPSGGWGVGIVEVEQRAQVEALTHNDPAIQASAGFRYDVFEMPQLMRAR